MTIEAPLSKYKKTNFKIAIAGCIIFSIVFAYDGYLSKYQWSLRRSFYEEHVKDGQPDDTMLFNQKAPIFLGVAAVVLTAWLWTIKDKKLLADENELFISDKEKILCDSIQRIDKTYFDSKGFFVITYKDKNGNEVDRKLSDKTYDNLAAVLDHLVAKIG
jgi:nitrogen fixation-related uncharacterized protein